MQKVSLIPAGGLGPQFAHMRLGMSDEKHWEFLKVNPKVLRDSSGETRTERYPYLCVSTAIYMYINCNLHACNF